MPLISSPKRDDEIDEALKARWAIAKVEVIYNVFFREGLCLETSWPEIFDPERRRLRNAGKRQPPAKI